MYGEVLPVNYLSWTCVQLTVKLLSVRWGTELEVTTEIAVCSHLILPVLMSSYAVRHYKVEGVVSMLSCLCVHVGVYCDNGATTGSLWLSDRLSNEPRSVLACSMADLLQSCRSQSLGARLTKTLLHISAILFHPNSVRIQPSPGERQSRPMKGILRLYYCWWNVESNMNIEHRRLIAIFFISLNTWRNASRLLFII